MSRPNRRRIKSGKKIKKRMTQEEKRRLAINAMHASSEQFKNIKYLYQWGQVILDTFKAHGLQIIPLKKTNRSRK